MKEKGMKIAPGLIAMLIIALWSSCTVEHPFSGTSNVVARFGLKSTAAMNGKITIGEAYLKLDRIEVTGNLGGNNNPPATYSISPEEPPYRLTESDSSHVNFSVQSRAYDELDLHLFLKQEDYELVFLGESVGGEEEQPDVPQPGENEGDADADEDGEPDSNGDAGSGGDAGGEGNEDAGGNDQSEDKEGNTDEKENSDDKEEEDDNDDDGHKDDDDDDEEDDDEEDDDEEDDDEGDDDDDKDDKDHKGDKDDDKKDKDKDRGDDDDDDDKEEDDDDGDDDRKSSNAENRAVDLDHFFQNAKPGLVVFGIYQNNGKVINLIFAATNVEKISMRGRQNDNTSILLAAQNSAQVTFDPEKWFESLTSAEIESGSMQTYQRQTVLFIHPAYNAELYQSIVSKLEGSADLHFSLPEAAGI